MSISIRPKQNKIKYHRMNMEDYDAVAKIIKAEKDKGSSPDVIYEKVFNYLKETYNARFGTRVNYKYAGENISRTILASMLIGAALNAPKVVEAYQDYSGPAFNFVYSGGVGVYNAAIDYKNGIDLNAESNANNYLSAIGFRKIFNLSFDQSIYNASGIQQKELWDSYWASGRSQLSKEESYQEAIIIRDGQEQFQINFDQAVMLLNRSKASYEKRLKNTNLAPEQIDMLKAQLFDIDKRMSELNEKVKNITPEFYQNLDRYVSLHEAMEPNSSGPQ